MALSPITTEFTRITQMTENKTVGKFWQVASKESSQTVLKQNVFYQTHYDEFMWDSSTRVTLC